MAVSRDGSTLYAAALGSDKGGGFFTQAPEAGTFVPSLSNQIRVSGGGPTGLVLDSRRGNLYVLTRFDDSVHVIDPNTGSTLDSLALHNPEPPSVVAGRPFLYNATISSGNGETSCASCHIFADFDSLAWNLGDPDASVSTNNQPVPEPLLPAEATFHPMKGPMTTQTLRGLSTHGAMHWRGDRLDGFFGTDACNQDPNLTAPCDEDFSFRNFIVAFEGLVGKESPDALPSLRGAAALDRSWRSATPRARPSPWPACSTGSTTRRAGAAGERTA